MIIYECSPIFEDFSTKLNSEERQSQLENAISLLSESIDMDMIISEKFDFVNEGVGDFFKGVLEKIKQALKAIKEFFQGLIQKIKEKFGKAKAEAQEKVVDEQIKQANDAYEKRKEENERHLYDLKKKYEELVKEEYRKKFAGYFGSEDRDAFESCECFIMDTKKISDSIKEYKDYFIDNANRFLEDETKWTADMYIAMSIAKEGSFTIKAENDNGGYHASLRWKGKSDNYNDTYGYHKELILMSNSLDDHFPKDFSKVKTGCFSNLIKSLNQNITDLTKIINDINDYISEVEKFITKVENANKDDGNMQKICSKYLHNCITGLNKDKMKVQGVITFINDELSFVNECVAIYKRVIKEGMKGTKEES